MSNVVYTTMFGEYENLQDPYITPNCDYVCFTDQDVTSDVWQIRKVNVSSRLEARKYKTMPTKILPGYEFYVWQDNIVTFQKNIKDFFNNDLSLFLHSERKNIYEEFRQCVEWCKDSEEVMGTQVSKYEKEGFPKDFPLFETTVLVSKNTPEVENFFLIWQNQIMNYSIRDQLSVGYSLWKTEINYSILPGYIAMNDCFKVQRHRKYATTRIGSL